MPLRCSRGSPSSTAAHAAIAVSVLFFTLLLDRLRRAMLMLQFCLASVPFQSSPPSCKTPGLEGSPLSSLLPPRPSPPPFPSASLQRISFLLNLSFPFPKNGEIPTSLSSTSSGTSETSISGSGLSSSSLATSTRSVSGPLSRLMTVPFPVEPSAELFLPLLLAFPPLLASRLAIVRVCYDTFREGSCLD
jgi:hypothetical protein